MRFTAWLVLIATLMLWSGNWIVARAVRNDIAPGIATVGRLFIVLAILVPFAAAGLRKKFPLLEMRDWLVLLALGFTGGGLHLALQWLGLHYTTATSGILYLSISPIFILLMAAPLAGERIGLRQWIGVAMSFCGVVIIATRGDLDLVSFNIGDMLALASMALFSVYTVLLRVRRDPLDIAELLTMVCASGLLFMLPWLAWELAIGAKIEINTAGALAILYSGVCSQLIAYLGWSYVVMRVGAAQSGVTLHLMPALGVLMAVIFLREYPAWYHFGGITLILAGVALSSSRYHRNIPRQEPVQ